MHHWSYDLIERDSFPDAYAAFLMDYVAVNVTTPFKEEAFRAADTWDYSALRCQASNLMVKTSIRDTCAPQPIENATLRQAESGIARFNGEKQSATGNIPYLETAFRIMAYNTDFEAVLEILRQECPEPGGCRVLIIGCGGAGKAATAAAIEAGMQTRVYNRTLSRPREFAEHLRTYNPHACSAVPQIIGLDSVETPIAAQSVATQSVVDELLAAIRDSDTIIYTIPGRTLRQDRHRSQLQGPRLGLRPMPPLHSRPHLASPPGHRHLPHRPRPVLLRGKVSFSQRAGLIFTMSNTLLKCMALIVRFIHFGDVLDCPLFATKPPFHPRSSRCPFSECLYIRHFPKHALLDLPRSLMPQGKEHRNRGGTFPGRNWITRQEHGGVGGCMRQVRSEVFCGRSDCRLAIQQVGQDHG